MSIYDTIHVKYCFISEQNLFQIRIIITNLINNFNCKWTHLRWSVSLTLCIIWISFAWKSKLLYRMFWIVVLRKPNCKLLLLVSLDYASNPVVNSANHNTLCAFSWIFAITLTSYNVEQSVTVYCLKIRGVVQWYLQNHLCL